MENWKEKIEEMKSPMSKIDLKKANSELEILLDKYDWFAAAAIEGNAICVYVSHLNKEIMALVPSVFYGHQVKLGYESYLFCQEKYGNTIEINEDIDPLWYSYDG